MTNDPDAPARPALDAQTRAVRAGRRGDGTSLAPVLWPTSTFVTPTVDDARRMATSVGSDRFYTRYGNPTVGGFEDAIAELEGAEAARAFSSGMGAVSAVVLGLCSSGDHIVAQRQLYAATQLLFQAVCPRFGIDVTFVDGTEPGAFAAAVRPGKTVLVFGETPANPKLDVIDLDALGAIAGPITVVDATFGTPILQQPLRHGVDLVLHSATKGIAGHNDATLGVVAGSRELIDWLWGFAVLQGASASPYDALNAIRGIRTLPIRIRQQSESALVLARALEARPDVEDVRYPGLPSHPQHELAMRQMSSGGGLVTFDVAGGLEGGRRFVEAVRIAQLATSLGGPETLVTHPASTTHVNLLPDELAANGIGPGTIRVSVGLEHVDDLIADFAQALDVAAAGPVPPSVS
ncbi:aminotransferase class I/II-fold pyridoxal phosphate-dependent enzyme [Aquihabitans sp. G128]|uniref:trans-sulfuration enzyme family protein n=1 Tax=Aquihabitans sp. G128 TaxID=2849779 RepID=UPI001C23152A|nr:aminotransferase class I/II-fold pyridoxal phosphate-dependent enzyme [Aquihabitans sp. G128]QXC61590.1 aminotransferase class I/II-fold pyridoxal phosphate-dependent enzyme [Aquihabitans sp. G128]